MTYYPVYGILVAMIINTMLEVYFLHYAMCNKVPKKFIFLGFVFYNFITFVLSIEMTQYMS